MAQTTEERIQQLETLVAQLIEIIDTLPTAYVSKLQWKQLDTVKSGAIEDKLTEIERLLVILDNRLKILEQV